MSLKAYSNNHSDSGDDSDLYAAYEADFDPLHTSRKARRKRKPQPKHTPKKAESQVLEDLAAIDGLEGGFKTTYQPSLFEQGWLLESLQTFYDQALITDVLARLKGGKEANVYRCAAHPSTGLSLIAAKVYRPRQFRNLRNDKMYREGREVLDNEGKLIRKNEQRLMRALGKKTNFGVEVSHTSWLMYEHITLEKLHKAGAAVPAPYGINENTILMTYCGDEHGAAPALSEVLLDFDEAVPLFNETMRNIELMLRHGMIHGDLSAYNILYWEGRITLIDFPQVTFARSNPHAASIFRRDVQRVCEYFAKCGVERDPDSIARHLWRRYGAARTEDVLADISRTEDDAAE